MIAFSKFRFFVNYLKMLVYLMVIYFIMNMIVLVNCKLFN